ncbi:hypothetical protein GR247_33290 [Rhizobium leguminosarum]|nr:hypothetical protein [Rhizobium leguminosarum]
MPAAANNAAARGDHKQTCLEVSRDGHSLPYHLKEEAKYGVQITPMSGLGQQGTVAFATCGSIDGLIQWLRKEALP